MDGGGDGEEVRRWTRWPNTLLVGEGGEEWHALAFQSSSPKHHARLRELEIGV
jgi:hypothetical protein